MFLVVRSEQVAEVREGVDGLQGSGGLGSPFSFRHGTTDLSGIPERFDLPRDPQRAQEGHPGAGTGSSIVDAVFGPVFRYFDVIDGIADFDIFQAVPRVRAWRAALAARSTVSDAVDSAHPSCCSGSSSTAARWQLRGRDDGDAEQALAVLGRVEEEERMGQVKHGDLPGSKPTRMSTDDRRLEAGAWRRSSGAAKSARAERNDSGRAWNATAVDRLAPVLQAPSCPSGVLPHDERDIEFRMRCRKAMACTFGDAGRARPSAQCMRARCPLQSAAQHDGETDGTPSIGRSWVRLAPSGVVLSLVRSQ